MTDLLHAAIVRICLLFLNGLAGLKGAFQQTGTLPLVERFDTQGNMPKDEAPHVRFELGRFCLCGLQESKGMPLFFGELGRGLLNGAGSRQDG